MELASQGEPECGYEPVEFERARAAVEEVESADDIGIYTIGE